MSFDWRLPPMFNRFNPVLKAYECPEYNFQILLILTLWIKGKNFEYKKLVERVDWWEMKTFFESAWEACLRVEGTWKPQQMFWDFKTFEICV